MENNTAFESIVYVTKNSLRYSFGSYLLSFEDLWSIDQERLNAQHVRLVKALRELEESIEISREPKAPFRGTEELQHMDNALLYVLETRASEAAAKLAEEEKRKQKKRIMEIIARKEQSELENKSVEELKAMLEE